MSRYVLKLASLFRLYFADVFAYKAASVIWVLADLQAALMMPIVWRAVGGLQGYSKGEVTTYYVVAMTLSQFVTCHLLWDIAFDIREGAFTAFQVRPFSHRAASFVRNIAWRCGKLILFIPLLLLLLPLYGLPSLHGLHPGGFFVLTVVLGQTVAFLSAYCMAMVTLWTTEFVSLFQLYYFPELLLSGRVVPLSALPEWARRLADWTHFRYTVSFPTETLLGKLSPSAVMQGLAAQAAWCVVFWWLGNVLYARGVRHYSGFGM